MQHARAISLLLTSVLLLSCQDQSPDRAPDVFGVIENVNMGVDRATYIVVNKSETKGTLDLVKLNIDAKTKVVWYASGDEVYSHHQNIRIGRTVRAWGKSAIVDGNPPTMDASRIELSSVARVSK